jgi:prenyl protein peptidase
MGYLPPEFTEAAKCMALTCILFLGPLFEAAIVEGAWRDWLRLRGAGELFGSWIGYRNIVAVS